MLENINSYDELIEHLDKKSAEFVPAPYITKEQMGKRWGLDPAEVIGEKMINDDMPEPPQEITDRLQWMVDNPDKLVWHDADEVRKILGISVN